MKMRYFMGKDKMSIDVITRRGRKYVFFKVGSQQKPTGITEECDQNDIAKSEFVVETTMDGVPFKIQEKKRSSAIALSFTKFDSRPKKESVEKKVLNMINPNVIKKPKKSEEEKVVVKKESIILTADEDDENVVHGVFQLKKDGTPYKVPIDTYLDIEKADKHLAKLIEKNDGKKYDIIPV